MDVNYDLVFIVIINRPKASYLLSTTESKLPAVKLKAFLGAFSQQGR
jgi:hypothetical protein